MTLELKPEEAALLAFLVQRELEELGPEIHHTRTSTYRQDLKERKNVLTGLLERLGAPQPAEL